MTLQAIEFGASTLVNVNLRSILSLSAEKPTEVIVTLDNSYWKVVSAIARIDGDPKNVGSTVIATLHRPPLFNFDCHSRSKHYMLMAICHLSELKNSTMWTYRLFVVDVATMLIHASGCIPSFD